MTVRLRDDGVVVWIVEGVTGTEVAGEDTYTDDGVDVDALNIGLSACVECGRFKDGEESSTTAFRLCGVIATDLSRGVEEMSANGSGLSMA